MLPSFVIFGHRLVSYYLCAATAGLVILLLPIPALQKAGAGRRSLLLSGMTVLAALVGARFLNFFLNPRAYGQDFSVWDLSYKKLSLIGGLLLAAFVLNLSCHWGHLPFWHIADCFVFPGAAAICILKLGCFLNGCCYGQKTTGPLGVYFPSRGLTDHLIDLLPGFASGVRTVYPTQLFELFGYLLGTLLLALLVRRHPLKGYRALLYGIWVILIRLAVHPFRWFPYTAVVVKVAYPAFYVALLVGMVTCLVRRLRRRQ